MGYKFKLIPMSQDEMQEALTRIRSRVSNPKEWFTARDARERREVVDTLASAGLLDSSCVSRSSPYYRIREDR